MDGWMNKWTDSWIYGWVSGWTTGGSIIQLSIKDSGCKSSAGKHATGNLNYGFDNRDGWLCGGMD